MPHNLQWRDVWSMLGAIPEVQAVEDHNGTLKVTRHGQTLMLHRPRGKDLADKQELTCRSGTFWSNVWASAEPAGGGGNASAGRHRSSRGAHL